MGFSDVMRTLFARPPATERLHGLPPSGNGASSHHLFWRLPDVGEPIVAVGVDLEVREAPTVDRLYFWALQASFAEHGVVTGAGHLGLQHHPAHPGGGAVNWGGYHAAASGRSGELAGSPLTVPSAVGNVNTGDYPWQPDRRYGLRIARVEEGAWAGLITDERTGEALEVRRLYCLGDGLRDPMVWTEAFAACDDPPVAVRWSSPYVETGDGSRFEPSGVTVNYQSIADGGCSTSNSELEGAAVVQRTGVVRTTPAGAVLGR